MKKLTLLSILTIGLIIAGSKCFANTTNVYVINNVTQAPSNQGSNIMCTRNASLCTNGYFILSTRGARYLSPQWKRQTLREKRISEENARAAAKINY